MLHVPLALLCVVHGRCCVDQYVSRSCPCLPLPTVVVWTAMASPAWTAMTLAAWTAMACVPPSPVGAWIDVALAVGVRAACGPGLAARRVRFDPHPVVCEIEAELGVERGFLSGPHVPDPDSEPEDEDGIWPPEVCAVDLIHRLELSGRWGHTRSSAASKDTSPGEMLLWRWQVPTAAG